MDPATDLGDHDTHEQREQRVAVVDGHDVARDQNSDHDPEGHRAEQLPPDRHHRLADVDAATDERARDRRDDRVHDDDDQVSDDHGREDRAG